MRTWRSASITFVVIIAFIALLQWLAFAPRAAAGQGHTPVTICHHAGPNPDNWHTITVDDDSVTLQAHLGHGDTLGPCTDIPTPTPTASVPLTEPTPTPTPTTAPSVEPSATPTNTPTASVRPTPTIVGLTTPPPTLPPTDTSTTDSPTSTSPGLWLLLGVLAGGLVAVLARRFR